MAFEGNLSELEFGDVVQTLSMTRQYGTLVVRGHEVRRVAFSESGLALLSARRSHEEQVARFLVGMGRCDADVLSGVLRATRRDATPPIGELLREKGAVTDADLLAARRYVAQEQLFELFRWAEGEFEFHADQFEDVGAFATLHFDVNSIAMEAARRIDETPRLDVTVAGGEVLVFFEPDAAPQRGEAPDDVVQLFLLADGSRTVDNIIADHHLGAFDTRKALSALIEARAIRPATFDELLLVANQLRDGKQAARLLRRAIELNPAEYETYERLSDVLAKAGDKHAAAAALAHLAELQHTDRDATSALESLQRALKLDRDNPTAQAIHTSVLLAAGDVDQGIEAATECISRCLARGDVETALRTAEQALEYRPDDLLLCRAAADAHVASGALPEALAILDRLAAGLLAMPTAETQLVDVYRAIVAIDPQRTDCHEGLAQIAAVALARRRRQVRGLAVVAALLIVSAIAVPFAMGPSLEERVDQATVLLLQGDEAGCRAILDELDPGDNEDDQILVNGLRARLEKDHDEPEDSDNSAAELQARVSELYALGAKLLGEGRLDEGLAAMELAALAFSEPLGRQARTAAPAEFGKLSKELGEETQVAFATVLEFTTREARWAASAVDEFTVSEALKRASFTVDPDDVVELRRLADLAAEAKERSAAIDWEALLASADHLAEIAQPTKSSAVAKIHASVELVRANLDRAVGAGGRATGYVDRSRLLTRFREVSDTAPELVNEGRLDEAADLYNSYLELCATMRGDDHGATYRKIIDTYMEMLPMESLHRTQVEMLEEILAAERQADGALAAGDVESAFKVRVDLVRQYPPVGFTRRFELPLRILSEPTGAQIVIQDATGDRIVGRTPATIEYPVSGETHIAIRLDGFQEETFTRHGATLDSKSEAMIHLAKETVWTADGGAVTEATPIAWRDRMFVADRDGVVRSLSLTDGKELARIDTKLLGGFASAPAVHESRLFVAGVDGIGFVLDAKTLTKLGTFELGNASRTALLATPAGVIVVDDRGTIRLLDKNGAERWAKRTTTITVDPALSSRGVVSVTMEGRLIVRDLDTGAERLNVALPGQPRWSAPVIADKTALVTSESGVIVAIDLASGASAWTRVLEETLTGHVGVASDVVLVNTLRGQLFRVPMSADAEPSPASRISPPGDGIVSSDDGFVIAGRTGIVRYLANDGVTRWRFDAGAAISGRPVVTDTHVLIVTRAGVAIALER